VNAHVSPEGPVSTERSRERLSRLISRGGEWILVAAFLATPMTSLRLGGSVTVGDILLTLASLLALLLLALRPRLPLSSPWIWSGGAILALSILVVQVFPPASVDALVTSFDGLSYGSSLTTGARLLIAAVVLPVVVSIIVTRWSAIDLLARAFILGVSVSCAAALIDAYAGTSIQTSLAANSDEVTGALISQPPRYVGLTGHPNILSLTVVLCLPLVLGRMTSVRGLLLNLPLCVLFLIAILLSGSRAGLIGIAMVVVLSLALNPRIRKVALSLNYRVLSGYAAGLAVALLLAFVVPVQAVPIPGVPVSQSVPGSDDGEGSGGGIAGFSRLDPGSSAAETSDSIRWQYIEESVDHILDRPLIGYGYEWIETSHNIYLQLLLSGGLLALIGYLLVIFGYLREIVALRRRVSGPRLDLLIALAVSILTYLVMGLVSPDLVDRYLYLPAALVLSMAVLVRSQPEPLAGVKAQAEPSGP